MKRKLIIGSLFSALFLYLAARGIDWSELWQTLKQARYVYLVPSIAFTLLNLYLRSYRWGFMLRQVKRIPQWNLFSATSIGYMANNLLPARLGEVVRAYILGRDENISKTASFASIVYERIVDVFSLLILLWVPIFSTSGLEWMRTTGLWLLVLNVVAFSIVILMERHREAASAIVRRIASPLPQKLHERIVSTTEAFISGLGAASDVRAFVPIVITSFLTWISAMLAIYFCFGAMNLALPIVAGITIIVFVSFGSMIPSAPAYVGTTQYAIIVGLALYGIDKSEALAFALVYHASVFVPVTVLGLILLWRAHLRLDDLSETRLEGRKQG